jgi:putative endonuclease
MEAQREKYWIVYLVRCSDKTLYCGISNDLKSRLLEHNSGKGAKYTRPRRPVELVGISPEMTKSEALKLEYRVKQLPADKKITEIKREEIEMPILKKDLQSLQKQIKALEKKIAKLIAATEKSEKPKAAKQTTAKSVKAKVTKKAPAKKAQPTATDQVLKIIKRSKKGVDTATLMKKTGFDEKKIRNILFRTYKQGNIKRAEKGVYVSA